MAVTEGFQEGRSSFSLQEDRDYSGVDVRSVHLIDSNALSHSFLNGTNIVDGAFLRSALDQCEFAEAYIEGSRFKQCDFGGSDLVRAKVSNTSFESCTFENGEWRETSFEGVDFTGCDFTHTTINLCTFERCSFSGGSVASLDHRSINYNVFTSTSFDELVMSEYVLSQNFGLPATGSRSPMRREGMPTLHEVCRSSDSPSFRIRDLVGAIEGEVGRQTVRANKLGLEFMANIVVALASTRRISPSSMLYVEQVFTQLARTTTSNSDFQAAMGAVVSIRNAMYDLVVGMRAGLPTQGGVGRVITAFFQDDDFPEEVGAELAEVLSFLFFGRPGSATLASIRHGSTWMEFLLAESVPIAGILTTLGLIFTQADIVISKAHKIKEGAKELLARKSSAATALVPVDSMPDKVPAILKSGTVLPELGPIRISVDRSGRTLIMLDNRVEITIDP